MRSKGFDASSLTERDAALIERLLPWTDRYIRSYVRASIEGLENIPETPAMFVANHNGGIFGPDLLCTLGTLWKVRGVDAPLYAMAHDFAMRQLTPLGRILQKLGAMRADPENARKVFAAGGQVLVYPGGDLDAYRSFRDRDRVMLGDRRGFLRVARECGVPIVPVVVQGAHRSAVILHDGAWLADRIRLQQWARLRRFPVALCLPWGVALGPWTPYLPLPFKLRMRILPPMRVDHDEPLPATQRRVHASMQRALDELCEK